MTEPAHADPNGGLLKNEPVVVGHFVTWLLLNVGLIIVGRYHIVSDATWNALSSALAPEITAALLVLSAWFIRRVVTPAWKLVQAQQQPRESVVNVFSAAPAVTAADLEVRYNVPDLSDADNALAAAAEAHPA